MKSRPKRFASSQRPRQRERPLRCEYLEDRRLLSASPRLIADLTVPQSAPQWQQDLLVANGTLFFSAWDPSHGRELWRLDNASGKSVLVQDINPGPGDGIPSTLHPLSQNGRASELTNVGGTLYFRGDDGVHGVELWKSDGTTPGTQRLPFQVDTVDVNGNHHLSDAPAAEPIHLTNIGGTLFFTAAPFNERELWKSQGTPASTSLVKNINTQGNNTSSFPAFLTNVNGVLMFAADDGFHGRELWRSDGSASGTYLVRDIQPGATSSNPAQLTNANGALFFGAQSPTNGFEFFRSNGTEAGTFMAYDVAPNSQSSYPQSLTNVNGVVYFTADDGTYTVGNRGRRGRELWRSGLPGENGAELVDDIVPGPASSIPSELTDVGGFLAFTALDSGGVKRVFLRNTITNATSVISEFFDVDPDGLKAIGTTLYFRRSVAGGGGEGEAYDFITGTRTTFPDIWPGPGSSLPQDFTRVNNVDYFTADDGSTGRQLYRIASVNAFGIAVVERVPALYSSNDSPLSDLTAVGSNVFFTADNGLGAGRELWTSDGTFEGTRIVKDVWPGIASSDIRHVTNVNGTAYFFANDGDRGPELWKSDGQEAGTVMVKDIVPGGAGSFPYVLTNVNGTLYFTVWTPDDAGRELWRSDGTSSGTYRVKDIRPGIESSYPADLTNVNGTLYFTADDGFHGRELWQSDGSGAGTIPVRAINGGSLYDPQQLTNVGGRLFFTSDDGVAGRELYVSNGISSGTNRVRDIGSGPVSGDVRGLTDVNGTAYFFANDGEHGPELWQSDGTQVGTIVVKDIIPGANGSFPYFLTNVGGTLYFTVWTPDDAGRELWRSNGTAAGTIRVKNIQPGLASSYPGELTNVNGTLYFAADDGVSGRELWHSDGTASGTQLVADIQLGGGGSDPRKLINAAGHLFFSADDGLHGRELWGGGTPGDLNDDRAVDAADASLMFAHWGESGIGDISDLNVDGVVDAADAGIMFQNWTGDSGPVMPALTAQAPASRPKTWCVLRLRARDVDRAMSTYDIGVRGYHRTFVP